jgi:hypothetical protein
VQSSPQHRHLLTREWEVSVKRQVVHPADRYDDLLGHARSSAQTERFILEWHFIVKRAVRDGFGGGDLESPRKREKSIRN